MYDDKIMISNFISYDKDKYDEYIKQRMYKEYNGSIDSKQKSTWESFFDTVGQ